MPPKKRENGHSTPQAATSRRRSARVSSTGKKSNYFEDDVDESDGIGVAHKPAKNTKKRARSELEHVGDDESDEAPYAEEVDSSSRENEEEEGEDEDDESWEANPALPTKRGRGRPPGKSPKKISKKTKEEGDSDAAPPRKRGRPSKATPKSRANAAVTAGGGDESDEENWVTFEPLPQLRDAGGIEYEDTRIHPNTLAFLKDLKANNKRSWLKGM